MTTVGFEAKSSPFDLSRLGGALERLGTVVTLDGLALVIGWIGAMKFTAYEAQGIEPLVRHSPLLSWSYAMLGVEEFSTCLGMGELVIAGLILARRVSPWASALGGALGALMFLTTLSFLVTTPGVFEPSLGGFPALSASPGQFLVKDVVLLGASLWLAGTSLVRAGTDTLASSR